jgi:hypothetical protein
LGAHSKNTNPVFNFAFCPLDCACNLVAQFTFNPKQKGKNNPEVFFMDLRTSAPISRPYLLSERYPAISPFRNATGCGIALGA